MNGTNLLLPERVSGTPAPTAENKARLFRDRLFVKVHDRMVRLFLHEVLWVEAYDYYSKVVTRQRELLVTQPLKRFDEVLTGTPEMMRVHRSYMVNLMHIDEIGEAFITINNQPIPISKMVKADLLTRWQKM
ncbi:MAG: LytTR family transcriptional regulator [Lewinellaceae bacterium]|nr:LytTR family transcriptional regulator [Lewinellaceae bacterium]